MGREVYVNDKMLILARVMEVIDDADTIKDFVDQSEWLSCCCCYRTRILPVPSA
jgi:hypothetical protein